MIKLAQGIPSEVGDPSTWGIPTPTGAISDIPSFATHVLNWLLGIAGFLAVIAIIYAGFMYLTSAGDSAQAENAKKNFTWAIIGIIFVALAAVIVNTVQDLLSRTASGSGTVATAVTTTSIKGSATTNLKNTAAALKAKGDTKSLAAAAKVEDLIRKLENGTVSEAGAGKELEKISQELASSGIPNISNIAQNIGKSGDVLSANAILGQLEKVTDPNETKKIGGQLYQLGQEIGAFGNSELAQKIQQIGLQIQAGADLAKMIQELKNVLNNTNNQSSTSSSGYDYTPPDFREPTPTSLTTTESDGYLHPISAASPTPTANQNSPAGTINDASIND